MEFRRAYRCNAAHLDRTVLAAVSEFVGDRRKLRGALKSLGLFGDELDRLANRGKTLAKLLEGTRPEWLPDMFTALLHGVEISEETVSITFRSLELRRFMDANFERAAGRRRRIDRALMNGEWPVLLKVMGKGKGARRYLSMTELRTLFVQRQLPRRMRDQLPA